MKFLHVFIRASETAGHLQVAERDLSQSDLEKGFLRKYRRGEDLMIESHIIRSHQIAEVHIIETDKTFADTLQELQTERNVRRDLFSEAGIKLVGSAKIEEYELTQAGANVTRDYIWFPPGERSSLINYKNHLRSLLKWIGKIMVMVIAAGLTYWLGWG